MNTAGSLRTQVGGPEMRFASVHDALSANWECVVAEPECLAPGQCLPDCGLSPCNESGEGNWYYDTSYCPLYADWLKEELVRLDAQQVVCSSLNVYRYVLALADTPIPVAFDMHNVEGVLYHEMRELMPAGERFGQVLSEENAARIVRAEQAAVAAADIIWTCSVEDRNLVRRTYPSVADKEILHVPDVVNVEEEAPGGDSSPPQRAIFTARLDYYPNVVAAETLLGEVATELSDFPVVVAGAQPDERLTGRDWPSNACLLADPPSVAKLFTDAVMVVPLTAGGGSRFKVIEAFAAGTPVVSTRKGAEGLGAFPGEHYLAAETVEEFVHAIRIIREDAELRAKLVRAAWALASREHSTRSLADRLRIV